MKTNRDCVTGVRIIEIMGRVIALSAVCSSGMMLLGCAGAHSDFECNATSNDSCMTMEQANDRARAGTENSPVKPVVPELPHLVDAPIRAKENASAPGNPLNGRHSFLSPITATSSADIHPSQVTNRAASPSRKPCSPVFCVSASKVLPVRSPATTVNVWIAPYVDTDDVLHQPGRISFVSSHPRWLMPALVK